MVHPHVRTHQVELYQCFPYLEDHKLKGIEAEEEDSKLIPSILRRFFVTEFSRYLFHPGLRYCKVTPVCPKEYIFGF